MKTKNNQYKYPSWDMGRMSVILQNEYDRQDGEYKFDNRCVITT